MSILELIHLLLAPFTLFSKTFLELIINGGNIKSLLQKCECNSLVPVH